ncbi:hypothetical protein Nepgr_008639 [Nepenthes gracilis]|uniref:Surfeit locus protein 2 n=1 Tax=Nepenthes gracilis TaxID=150966 RepID=A0AAD3S9C5_NEPGR|nr:hypothetical protein Nepgr_008639 [Nepenthes gracilis]
MPTIEEKKSKCDREGSGLLGLPTFEQLENGRFRCVETGHELFSNAMDSYAKCKRCRVGLIDFALSNKKPPLNMFKQDPLCRSRLICKLTGDTINKAEEHIWKHINGKRFLHKLEQMEDGKITENGEVNGKSDRMEKEVSNAVENALEKEEKMKKKKGEKEKKMKEIVSEIRDSPEDNDSEELDFWKPPVGGRWDFDDGGNRWGSDSEAEEQNVEENGTDVVDEVDNNVSAELSRRTKRISIEIGPSSFASRKKKSKIKPTC